MNFPIQLQGSVGVFPSRRKLFCHLCENYENKENKKLMFLVTALSNKNGMSLSGCCCNKFLKRGAEGRRKTRRNALEGPSFGLADHFCPGKWKWEVGRKAGSNHRRAAGVPVGAGAQAYLRIRAETGSRHLTPFVIVSIYKNGDQITPFG